MTLIGLAWDDEPEYLKQVAELLERENVRLEVLSDHDEFISRYTEMSGEFDFVVLDLLLEDARSEGDGEPVGKDLASQILTRHPQLPVFMVTSRARAIDSQRLGLPSQVILKSKSTHQGWMAQDILRDLRDRGIYRDSRKVFLVYGHETKCDGFNLAVEAHLESRGLEVARTSEDEVIPGVLDGILERLRDAAAILAICTPDDRIHLVGSGEEPFYSPRGNVLIEIGMALALFRGRERLILLQRWGSEPSDQAKLPSDLGGDLSIRFTEEDYEAGELGADFTRKLEARLSGLRVSMALENGPI